MDLGEELEELKEFDEAPHNVSNRTHPNGARNKNSRALNDMDVFSTVDLANQRIAV